MNDEFTRHFVDYADLIRLSSISEASLHLSPSASWLIDGVASVPLLSLPSSSLFPVHV